MKRALAMRVGGIGFALGLTATVGLVDACSEEAPGASDSGVDATTDTAAVEASTGCVPDPGPGDSGISLAFDASSPPTLDASPETSIDAGVDGATDDAASADAEADASTDASADTSADASTDAPPAPPVIPDPAGGAARFTLEQALAGYPAVPGVLTARIDTELGQIVCRLDEKAAPITVANFVGLARGTRPYFKDGAWQLGKLYDGLIWHRVIPDFVIQGGDPKGNGTGDPGYSLPNENHAPQIAGALSMAAGNPEPNVFEPSGSQFYIVVGKGPKADYNVFGTCTLDVAKDIAAVERRSNDKPKVAVHMSKISIERCPR